MKENLRIGLLDDEEAPRIILADHISGIPGYDIAFSTDDPFWVKNAVMAQSVDILVTDIAMPGMSGLQLSKEVYHLDIPIIICSVHEELAIESYKVNTVGFLRKPAQFFDVSDALDKARKSLSKSRSPKIDLEEDIIVIKLHRGSKQILIRPRQIQYIEQQGAFTIIVFDDGESVEFRSSFSKAMAKISRPYIVQTHRSFAVNYLKIGSADQAYCYLISGHKVPIGSESRSSFFKFIDLKTQD